MFSLSRFLWLVAILVLAQPCATDAQPQRQIGERSETNDPSAMRAQHNVDELRKENRLADWATYVCYQDTKNLQTGMFTVIGFSSNAGDPFFHDSSEAKAFGYHRALTFQEYLSADTGITTLNVPISPEDFQRSIADAAQSGKIAMNAIDMIGTVFVGLHNAIAITKSRRAFLLKSPGLEATFLKDEEVQALLDAPDGTNFNNFTVSHPDYMASLAHREKYYSAGMSNPRGGFKVYREGHVLFEDDFGSNVFESAGEEGRIGTTSGIGTRIQMEQTASGLRYLESHSIRGSSIGIPITGACIAVPKQ